MTINLNKKFGIVFCVNVIIFFIIIEIFGAGIFLFRKGELFYTRHVEEVPAENETKFLGGNAFKRLSVVFHPYFGYVLRTNSATNNYGFSDPHHKGDIPFIPNDNQVVVGVFGGSVPGGFAIYAQGKDYFSEKIKQIPEFSNKEIVVLNFALGGFRHPQQVMVLTYLILLGQKFDVIIEIDGFNETVSGIGNNQNGIDISLPASDIWHGMARHIERLNVQSGDGSDVEAVKHNWYATKYGRAADTCLLTICYHYYKASQWYHRAKYDEIFASKRGRWEENSHFTVPRPHKVKDLRLLDPKEEYDVFMDRIVDLWERSNRTMARLAGQIGALYVQVLQPSLHFVVDRKIEPRNSEHGYQYVIRPVNTGYPKIISRQEKMRADGIQVSNATALFDNIKENLYSDDCCHYVEKGNDMMADFIVEQVRQAAETRATLRAKR